MMRGCSSEARGVAVPAKGGELGGAAGEVASDGRGLLVVGFSSREGDDEMGVSFGGVEETDEELSRVGGAGEVRS